MKNIQQLTDSLKTDLAFFHPHVISSAFLYGAGADTADAPAGLPVRAGLVFTDPSPSAIRPFLPMVKKYRKQVVFPFALSQRFLQESLDTFPLEILEFQSDCRPLLGENPLTGLAPDARNIRLQCERELKGKGMHLRSALFHRTRDSELRELIHRSSGDFHRIYLGILTLKGAPIALSPVQAAGRVAELCGLPDDTLVHVARNDVPQKQVYDFFVRYLAQIDKLTSLVDGGLL
ncbi:MAG: hypothetical protein V1913_02715 [Fibrobacterota bacterium]